KGGPKDPNTIKAAEEPLKELNDDIGPKAVEGDLNGLKRLIEDLKHHHPLVRDKAFTWLLKVKDDKAIDWLLKDGLKDPDGEVRADIAEAMQLGGVKRAVPALLKLLSSDKENRPFLISVIGDLGGKENADAVAAEAKRGKEARTRAEAIEALAKLDKEACVAHAKPGATDSEWQVRVASMRALAGIDEDGAFDGALANLKERRADQEKKKKNAWQPAFFAVKVLLGLEQREKRADGLKDALDQLVALLKVEHGRMKHEIANALRALVGKPDMDDDPKAWEEFWAVKRTSYAPKDTPRKQPPPLPSGKKGKKKGKDSGGEGGDAASDGGAPNGLEGGGGGDDGAVGTAVRYHGIPVWRDRVAFVIDLSGSMKNDMEVPAPEGEKGEKSGETGDRPGTVTRRKIDVSKDELVKTVNSLPEDVMFNIVTFSTDVKTWQKAIVAASKSAKASADDFTGKLDIEGRTNFFGALSKPLEDPLVDTVFFLTDGGTATDGKFIDQRRIVRKLHELNKFALVEINCLLFGEEGHVSGGALRWMEELSSESNGRFYIRPEPKK
ncbi:MAG TPA: HEAT repeat domain-containing protein, partial [Planctomycetota bacterium]|nr:HEAT repeat domain-containing protein [Planctomycetota bacterium]